MTILRRVFDFYIQSSLHVALAGTALVMITSEMFRLPLDYSVALFAFFGIIVAYNFVKYDALARTQKLLIGNRIKAIAVFSFLSFLAAAYFFLAMQRLTQLVSIAFLGLTLLYTLPFFPNRRNARNWAGVKIYIVAICWVGVTLVLPVVNAEIAITADFYIKCVQRFLFVFVLILIFEIIDLSQDDPHLKTVPQQIGVRNTKVLGVFLLIIFYLLEFFTTGFAITQYIVNVKVVLLMMVLLAFANEKRSKYFAHFWAELVPVFWFLVLISWG